jgi:UDP-N-acetylmuramoyl-tripeptide--D-alanyl-D-alanine ligase
MTSIKDVYAFFLSSSGVTTDSRSITKDKLFFALRGPNFDGNAYALSAIEKGACAAVVDDARIAGKHKKCLLVNDVLKTLQELANHHREQFSIPVIALTGSNGKTTTKELIAAVLGTTHNVLFTDGNLNNHIGVPLTLLRLTKNHTHALIEMGANHEGEIDFLCNIAKPTHGLITNIGKAHLEGFGSIEGVLRGKTELYRHLEKHKGAIFVNQEDKKLMGALGNLPTVTYSPSECRVLEDQPTLKLLCNTLEINTHLAGDYNKTNISAAICVGKAFGVPLHQSIAAIENYIPVNHRSQLIKKDNKTIILDAYNANPTSMRAAVSAFAKHEGKKVLILGFMAELGTHETQEHKDLVELVGSYDFDACFWVGHAYKPFVDSNWFATTADAKAYFEHNTIGAEQILIKGSRSTGLEILTDLLD